LWQLNLSVFGFLQPSATLAFSLLHIAYADVFLAALLGIMAFVGASRGSKFILAVSNHVSFACCCAISACWIQSGSINVADLLRLMPESTDCRLVMVAGLIFASAASAVASHLQYLRHFRRAENPSWHSAWPEASPALI
jgi:hypothetical protein